MSKSNFIHVISGKIVDVPNRMIHKGEITIQRGKILKIKPKNIVADQYILPGFIDAHIHIESSMVVPFEFAKTAVSHGTIAVVSDPHEIANVMGMQGVDFMIDNARDAKLKFYFGAPSCVPATSFETSGAVLDSNKIEKLLKRKEIYYLSEMMNYPGVLSDDPEVLSKIQSAQRLGKPIDGHAPGLKGNKAKKYIDTGISTDHECFTQEEALHKIHCGMKILIREGSAAKNYEALHPLIEKYSDKLMFCSDDKHPDDLVKGHINLLVKRSLQLGYDLFDVLKIACVNPAQHYQLDIGLLNEGDFADFIVCDSLDELNVNKTIIRGEVVYDEGICYISNKKHKIINNLRTEKKKVSDFVLLGNGGLQHIIEAIDGEIVTGHIQKSLPSKNGIIEAVPDQDILKICVVNRYSTKPVAIGFIVNFGIVEGAMASTVAHDSHNVIVVGSHDTYICRAVNLLIESKGGLSAVSKESEQLVSLPIAGLMSDLPVSQVADSYIKVDHFVKKMGCKLTAPYMTLSFMALLVIPKLKISDLGLFDVVDFKFT